MTLIRNFAAFAILIAIFAVLMHQGVFTWITEKTVGCDRIYICVRDEDYRLMTAGAYGIIAAVVMYAAARLSHYAGWMARLIVKVILCGATLGMLIHIGVVLVLAVPATLVFFWGLIGAFGTGNLSGFLGTISPIAILLPIMSTAALLAPAFAWIGMADLDR